ncbi:MAG: DUF1553 domain-containing protein [Planctomycetaceae bacterium]
MTSPAPAGSWTPPRSVLDALPTRRLPADADESARRAALAAWLTSATPTLWFGVRSSTESGQHHFGRGIVATPGRLRPHGERPSHPELLDWLAIELRDGAGSLKNLHRLILTSAAYQQTSDAGRSPCHSLAVERDSENRLLWRMERRQLEAEPVRDAMLAVAGLLNRGGGRALDFVLEKPEHSPHYEYHQHDAGRPGVPPPGGVPAFLGRGRRRSRS